MLREAFVESVADTLKLVPFLFVTYLLMEFLEHKTSEKTQEKIQHAGKLGPVFGGILGAIPQCGFSAAASNLFAGRVISMGTLLAIFLSTSDEMLPILISERVEAGFILKVLLMKIVIGIVAGLIVDFVLQQREKKHKPNEHEHDHQHHIHEMCEHDHCNCEESILQSAITHTLQITMYILIFTLALSLLIGWIGEENIANWLTNTPVLGEVLAGLIGLIPNCAASVVVTQMYLSGVLGFGAMMSGLLVGAGVGVLVLWKSNHNWKQNALVIGLLYGIGVLCGLVIGWLGI